VGENKIPAFKLGNRWRFKKSKLDEWMEEQSSEAEGSRSGKRKRGSNSALTKGGHTCLDLAQSRSWVWMSVPPASRLWN